MRWYLGGCVALGLFGVLAGCSGGGFFAEREPWRRDAEVQCINSGAVKESAGIVRIKSISGPGMCGADFPLRVSVLGESAPLGFADDPRPPGAIPGGGPRWPVRPAESADSPVSLSPPGVPDSVGSAAGPYDYRRPYGGPPPSAPGDRGPYAGSPRDDLSPVPYERRRLVDPSVGPRDAPPPVTRAPLRERAVYDPPPALGPRGSASVTGSVAPVSVTPAATLACPMVSELERWFATAVQPAALRWFGSPVAEIKQISAYSCRGMNGNPRARISEHAFGNALDIASFTLADGRTITVKGGWNGLPEEQGFLRDVQGAACAQFTTVLAPGSNVYHYDHIHVDLMRRSSGHRACNPQAVSGAEVAARAGARYAARRAGEPSVTGAVTLSSPPTSSRSPTASSPSTSAPTSSLQPPRRLPPPPKRLLRSDPYEDHRFPALPLAEPGNDGQDED